jgi:hypothetical protein
LNYEVLGVLDGWHIEKEIVAGAGFPSVLLGELLPLPFDDIGQLLGNRDRFEDVSLIVH